MNQPYPESQSGEWIMPPVSYVEPIRISCAFCGRPIARRYWQAAPAGSLLAFCDPDHASLYISYWLPLYGSENKAKLIGH